MATKATEEARKLLEEAINELEKSDGSVFTGIQKLSRASDILNDKDTYIWCEIQFGNSKYTSSLKKYSSKFKALLLEYKKTGKTRQKTEEDLRKSINELNELNLKQEIHYNVNEIDIRTRKRGGGYLNIGFIEDRYNDLVRLKNANDGIYYKISLSKHIYFIKREAYSKANRLYNKISFSDVPQTAFDVLKEEIDDKLLDLDPELAEKLMVAFKRVTTDNTEEWSQALTTCRRLIEKLADSLYPPTDEKINGRSLGKTQYINRIWAFMDKSIESKSDKKLAKDHIDFIGDYLKSLLNKTQKGVHDSVTRYEAVKAVMHTYLIVGDILDYLEKPKSQGKILNIHTASLDELESVLGVRRSIAKEIIKIRVKEGNLNEKKLASINGIGPKTLEKAKDLMSFEIPAK